MPVSALMGWTMFLLGTALVVLEIVAQAKTILARGERGGDEALVRGINETAEALAKLLEAFAKFSERMQRLLLGTVLMIGGIYLLSNTPF